MSLAPIAVEACPVTGGATLDAIDPFRAKSGIEQVAVVEPKEVQPIMPRSIGSRKDGIVADCRAYRLVDLITTHSNVWPYNGRQSTWICAHAFEC